MTCCPTIKTIFSNVEETNVPYDGPAPFVQVVYFEEGQYIAAGVFTQMKYTPGNIRINHGGQASGFVLVK